MRSGVLIAGGGLAAQRCAETLRRSGYEGAVTMVCGEPHLPYDRPPLSKEVLHDTHAERRLAFRPEDWYGERQVELLLGVEARGLDATARKLALSDGSSVAYEHLLIATGGRPRPLPAFERFANVSMLRTLEDARALRAVLTPGCRLLIIGAGFIGQEVAAAACKAGASPTIVEAAAAPLAGLLGAELGAWFAELHRSSGVELLLEEQVERVHGSERVASVTLRGGRRIDCDHVLVGVGIEPNVAWLRGSALQEAGVRTDVDGRSAVPGVYAAGDVAALFDPLLGRHVLGSHWETAGRQGARAAKAMLGLDPGPGAVSSFWSDLYGTRVQYLGHAPLADAVSFDGDPGSRDFTATFTSAGRVVAVLLAGRPQLLPQARALLATNNERTHP
ncbi:MAG TPA: FAD-dependent oxidoreductase [Solirubrobacteraceae bacterium]|nr:FAD-dependent oxidoreductase [Solirubrobacteraceae bacterium]